MRVPHRIFALLFALAGITCVDGAVSAGQLVLDVPLSATVIHVGAVVNGPGDVWIDSLSLDIVDRSVAITGREGPGTANSRPDRELPRAPRNLGFEDSQ